MQNSDNWFSSASGLARRLNSRDEGISGKLVDVSGLGITNAKGEDISEAILNFDFQFEAVESLSKVSNSDHLIVLASFQQKDLGNGTFGQLSNGITTGYGGKVMYVDADNTVGIWDWGSGYGTTVAEHELVSHALNSGHTGGVTQVTNGKGVYSWSRGFSAEAGRSIIKNLYGGKLNQGSVLTKSLNGVVVPITKVENPFGTDGHVSDGGVNTSSVAKNAKNKQ